MKQVSKWFRILKFGCVSLSVSAACGDRLRPSPPDWRLAPAIVAYKEFLGRNPRLWSGRPVAIDSQVRLPGLPGAQREEEPPVLFLLDRSALAHAPSSHFGEFRPYSAADSMELMVSLRMTVQERPVQDTVVVEIFASRGLFYIAYFTVVRQASGWTVSKYHFLES